MKRTTSRRLLIDRLFESYVGRCKPRDGKKDKATGEEPVVTRANVKTAHLQSMAQLFAEELLQLAAGAGECRRHSGRIHGACPYCQGLWPEAAS